MNDKTKRTGSRKPEHDINGPVRSWDEVAQRYNELNPDRPIPSGKVARQVAYQAMKKLAVNIHAA